MGRTRLFDHRIHWQMLYMHARMADEQAPSMLTTPPKLAAGKDPYRTASPPRRAPEPEPPRAVPVAQEVPPREAPSPGDLKELLFKAKLEVARRESLRENSRAFLAAIGVLVI